MKLSETTLALALLAILLLVAAFGTPLPYDDAYIHLKIARNFAEYGQPYFHLDTPVAGSTSLCWIFVCALLSLFFHSLVSAVYIFELLLLLLNALVWFQCFRLIFLKRKWLPIVAASVLVSGLLSTALGLMETPLLFLFLGLSLQASLEQKRRAFVWAVLAGFTRPEAFAFCLLLLLREAVLRKRQALQSLLFLIVSAVPFVFFQYVFFGSLRSHTAKVKSVVYDIPFEELLSLFLKGSFQGLFPEGLLQIGSAIFIAILFLIILLLLVSPPKSFRIDLAAVVRSPMLVLCGFSLLSLFAYFASGVLIASWYRPLVVVPPLLFLLFVLQGVSGSKRLLLLQLLFLFPVIATPPLFLLSQLGAQAEFYPEYASRMRVVSFRKVAEALNKTLPGKLLMAPEVGALGYFYDGYVFDAVGLVNPEALRFHPLKVPEQRASGVIAAVPAMLVQKKKPDILCGLEVFFEEVQKSDVSKKYRWRTLPILLREFPETGERISLWGSHGILLGVSAKYQKALEG